MKRILFTFLFLALYLAGYTQLSNNGGIITIENGATLVIEGNYTSTGTGNIEIDGAVQLKGNFINNNSGGPVINTNSDGTLTFNSTTAAQEIGGTASTNFGCAVVINNALGVSLTGADAVLSKALTLTNGKLTLNAYDLTMAAVGITATNGWIVTNNAAGELKAVVATTNVAFPVGSTTSYNPVILKNDGTSDTYGVVYSEDMPLGWTGADHYVDGSWTVSEVVADDGLLTVTPQWNGSQEVLPFDRNDCAVGVSEDLGATVIWASSGAAVGSDPYYRSGTGFTDVGTFLVGDAFYLFINLDLDLILAGPYNGTDMNTALTVPLTDPYGLGTTVGSIPANTVDWIKVQFRDKNDITSVLYERAFFLDNTGNVLNTDGASGAKITGVPKDAYYIGIVHRNHFGVASANTVNLLSPSPSYNFSTSQAQAWQNPSITTNSAMKQIGSVYALWEGDVNSDGIVNYFGDPNDKAIIVAQLGLTTLGIPISDGYSNNDVNMDATINYFGDPNDKAAIVAVLGLSTLGIPKASHLP